MRFTLILLSLMILLPVVARAETVYVTDDLLVSLREGQGTEHPVVKTVTSGSALEVLQRLGDYVLVREEQGMEGWIAGKFLSSKPPTRIQLATAKKELKQARAKLAATKKKLEASAVALKKEAARAREMEKELQGTGTAATGVPESASNIEASRLEQGFVIDYIWLAISFAMLVIGIIVGVIWLREVNRKKMGGMYLRI